jgi:curli biogenesis system outer membrane secretion channel CsgG
MIKRNMGDMMKISRIQFVLLSVYSVLFCLTAITDSMGAQLKKRVAVFDFEDKTSHQYHWWTGQPVGEGMADMLVTALVKTGNYQVIERQEIEKIMQEQQLGQSGAVTQQSAVQVGKALGVELAIFGAVTEFGYAEGTTGGRLKSQGFGIGIKSSSATVAVDVRFINTTTGDILLAESVRKEESKKGVALDTRQFNFENQKNFDESIVGKATRAAINEIVQLVDNSSQGLAWQGKIIKGDGPIYINAGSEDGIQIGDEFDVFRAGEELIDPDTGLSLGAVESKIGTIKVTNNSIGNGKASECRAISGTGFERNDIVRPKK